MRILQLCNKAPFPANDGSSIAIFTLAEGLADNDAELHLLSINTKKHFKPDANVPESFKQKIHYTSIFKNTDTSIIGAITNLFFSNQSYFVSRFFFKEYEEALIQTLTTNTFDIIQLEGVFMGSYISTIKQYSKVKIILRSHNVEHQIWERHLINEQNWLKKTYLTIQNNRLKQFELDTFHKVNAIVTITDEDKKIMASLTPKTPSFTCLTGINLSTYKNIAHPKQPNTFFHFASMDWMPNIEAVDWLLTNVWSDVLEHIPDAKLVLAGRNMPERFKKLQSKNITIIDNVDNSSEFYQTYDIMLVPLWSGSGLRIKLVEGLAYGKPIITTSIGAEGITYSTHTNLIIADSAQDFINAIINLSSNPSLKTELQNNARHLAETNFDYKAIAKQLISFYKSL